MFQRFWFTLMVMSVGGCVTIPWPNVMYSPQGNWLVVSHSEERARSIYRAYGAANNHCAQQQKRMTLLSEVTVYQGPLTQEVHEATKIASEALAVYGNYEDRQFGRTLSSPGEYRTTIEFRCQ